jgi:hypothetical protein
MCTLGAIRGRYIFKNRDLGLENSTKEEIIQGKRTYSYVGIAGKASAGERGLNSGINEKGVGAAITYVGEDTLQNDIANKIPRGVIIEDIVGNAATLLEAAEIIQRHLNRNTYVGGNIVVAALDGILSVEEIDRSFAFEFVRSDYFIRTNHFLNLKLRDGLLKHEKESQERYRIAEEYFKNKDIDKIGIKEIKEILSYHGETTSICKHGEAQAVTVSTAIYDLSERELHYSYGNPCKGEFVVLKPKAE